MCLLRNWISDICKYVLLLLLHPKQKSSNVIGQFQCSNVDKHIKQKYCLFLPSIFVLFNSSLLDMKAAVVCNKTAQCSVSVYTIGGTLRKVLMHFINYKKVLSQECDSIGYQMLTCVQLLLFLIMICNSFVVSNQYLLNYRP